MNNQTTQAPLPTALDMVAEEGYRANKDRHQARSKNPYRGDATHRAWNKGWDMAEAEKGKPQ